MKRTGLILLFVVFGLSLYSQGYLDFIENKGQWDAAIKFKTEIPGGALVLQANSYRVLQYHPEDFQRVTGGEHDHSMVVNESKKGKSIITKENANPIAAAEEKGVRSHTYEVKFLNANPNPQIVPDKVLTSSNNYFFGNDPNKWVSDCKIYQAVTYKNMYPNIDIRFYTNNAALKYDIIVHPGGDPSKVILYFDGIDGLKVKQNILQIKTSVALNKETIPSTYVLGKTDRKEVSCSYAVKGNFVSFKLNEKYDHTGTLVIDPSPAFASYSGSRPDNWGFTATYDGAGNLYSGGVVFGGGFPVTNGSIYKGGSGDAPSDICVMKFSNTGARIYATYIGGATNEQPHSMVTDRAGNLIIAGRTNSADYPTAGNLKTFFGIEGGGLYDIVLTKLNSNGGIISSIVIGGKGNDGVNIAPNYESVGGISSTRRNYGDDARSEVILDGNENILLASVTQSEKFPTTTNTFQRTHGSFTTGFKQDGVLIKVNPALDNIIFSSFLGGNGDDAPFVLSVNPTDGNIFVAGVTASDNLSGTGGGVVFPAKLGAKNSLDGFIMSIKSDGSAINRTTYIASTGEDIIFGIQFDKLGFPYITGTTTGSFPVINSPFNTKFPDQAAGKHFIAKLNPDLSGFIFFTNFGNGRANATRPSLSITAFLVDRCERLYVSGWGGTRFNFRGYDFDPLTGLPQSSDSYQRNTDEGDFYFIVLEKNGTDLLYGSYFGQTGGFPDHVDGGTSRFDPNGAIYQTLCSCANRESPGISGQIIGTPGAWSPLRGNTACNMFSVRFDFNKAGVASGVRSAINGRSNDSTGCVPLTVNFEDTVTEDSRGKKFYWDFGDGSPEVITTVPKVSHTFNIVGNYRVRLKSEDLTTCNGSETSYITIIVKNNAVQNLAFNYTVVQPCVNRIYEFTNLSLPPQGESFAANSFEWDFGDGSPKITTDGRSVRYQYKADGSYIVRLTLKDKRFCNEDDFIEQTIRISAALDPKFTATTACLGSPTKFTYTGNGGASFVWDFFGDGSATDTRANPEFTYPSAITYQAKLTVTDPNTCDINKSKSIVIPVVVSPIPIASFDYTPRGSTQPNQFFQFTNLSIGATQYQWNMGDGKSFITNKKDTVIRYIFPATAKYSVCLFASNAAGCIAKKCEDIDAVVDPLFNVPNAFSPNGDGVNDRVYVRGFGIAKMTWKIYNRWGSVVYIGTDQFEGWDGKFNGKLQPQEVYNYTLEIEFSSKERQTQTGDITLLR